MKKLIILLTPLLFLTNCNKNDDGDNCKCKAAIYINGYTGKEKAFYDVPT